MEEEYAQSLIEEFKKFLGEKVEEDFSVLQVRDFGPSCASCQKLMHETVAALLKLKLAADFDHGQDIKEIARYGMMGTPALVINGQVKSVGRVPPRKQIIAWLKEAQSFVTGLASSLPVIIQVLNRHRGNRTLTARELGVSHSNLWRKIRRFHLD